MAVATMAAPQLARRVRPAYVMAAGSAIAAGGLVILTRVPADGGLWMLLTGFTLASVGVALPSALGTDLVVGSAPKEKAGSAAGMSEMSAEFGIALGVAVFGSIGAAIYRSIVTVGPDVPADAATAAREGINGAVSAAGELPGAAGSELLGAAREAFTSGLDVAAVVGAVLFAALAILTATTLRHIRPSGADTESAGAPAPATAP
jgi:DHA2 family multidrug resistance protein-like MFS transporter